MIKEDNEVVKTKIAIGILIAATVGLGIYAGITIDNLRMNLNTLNTYYTTLEMDHFELQSSYNELNSSYFNLQQDFVTLENDYQSLSLQYDHLYGAMNALQTENVEIIAENDYLRRILREYENVPDGYYSASQFYQHPNTYEALCGFLSWEFELPTEYRVGVFDCSESAAYLEWALEIAGFNADIAVGPTPWDPGAGSHAWVIAYPGEYKVAIEPTVLTEEYNFMYLFTLRTPGIVYPDDPFIPGWQNYYDGYQAIFGNIYNVIRHDGSSEEWNWWEGYWGFK